MAQKDRGTEEPNLELPSLFGRRKQRKGEAPPEGTAPAPEPLPAPEVEPLPEPAAQAPNPTIPAAAPGRRAARADGQARAGSRAAVTPGKRAARPARERRSAPDLGGSTAALLVGAVTGLAGCVLTYLGLQGCELVTNTSSCGGPGLLVLVVIGVAMILAGAAMLRFLRVPEPGSVSFLGVGIMVVVVLVFLIDSLYDAWMFVAVPMVTAASFALARWVTTRYTDDVWDEDAPEPHDLR